MFGEINIFNSVDGLGVICFFRYILYGIFYLYYNYILYFIKGKGKKIVCLIVLVI